MAGAVPRQSAIWDERRNTSSASRVPPNALPEALAALRRVPPELRRWIVDGAPRLTEAEHLERFGEPYKALRRAK